MRGIFSILMGLMIACAVLAPRVSRACSQVDPAQLQGPVLSPAEATLLASHEVAADPYAPWAPAPEPGDSEPEPSAPEPAEPEPESETPSEEEAFAVDEDAILTDPPRGSPTAPATELPPLFLHSRSSSADAEPETPPPRS